MKFNIDRISQLAGISSKRRSSGLLSESYDANEQDEAAYEQDEMNMDLSEKKKKDAEDDLDEEVVEIDEADLVKELRRAKHLMRENKKRKQRLLEAELKAVIDQEVQNVLKELNLKSDSLWLYGNKKPTRSKKGYTHQGSFLKGIGFK